MKNSKTKVLAVIMGIFAFASNNGFAQTSGEVEPKSTKIENLEIKDEKGLRFKVSFENPSRQKMVITLTDENDNVLFSDYTNNDAKYNRIFDLSNIADGVYTFNVGKNKKEKINQSIEIRTEISRIALAKNRK